MAGSGTAHLNEGALLSLNNLVVDYRLKGGRTLHAVSDLSLDVLPGETLGLVGESGCGKSSAAKAALMLRPPDSGTITFDGRELTTLRQRKLRAVRSRLQLIFQDPISSLNPRRRVRDIVAEGLSIQGVPKPWKDKVDDALVAVGLNPGSVGDRHAAELSGGQCQRVAIARAIVLEPALIVCDEPVSALDVSIQAQILNLLEDMKQRFNLTLIFVAHDLAVVKNISDRVAVMYLGKLCEVATSDGLYAEPMHPYTRALFSGIPVPDPGRPQPPMLATGDQPSQTDPPTGCRFRSRCPLAQQRCAVEEPAVREVLPHHYVACHFAEDGVAAAGGDAVGAH
jgi:peptide/nickel transport system ATP-binding protein